MPTKHDLTIEDVLHIAKLANITLSKDNLEMYRKQLSETISYVENLGELDTKGVEPTSHATNHKNVFFKDGTKNERLFTQEEATQNTTVKKSGQFVVKRLM